MMLRLITPKDDPRYEQNEIRIQELLGRIDQETAMSMPHPDDEWQQMMDNFLLENPGMEFEDLNDFKQWYMDNMDYDVTNVPKEADFSPMDYAADGGLMKRPGYAGGGMTDEEKIAYQGLIDSGYTEDEAVRIIELHGSDYSGLQVPSYLKSQALGDARGGYKTRPGYMSGGIPSSEDLLGRKKIISGIPSLEELLKLRLILGGLYNKIPSTGDFLERRSEGGRVGMYGGGGMGDMDLTQGGASFGPGTGTSDEIPAMLSDGEFVVTANAVKNLGGGNRMLGAKRMYQMMNQLDPNSQTPAEMDTTGIA